MPLSSLQLEYVTGRLIEVLEALFLAKKVHENRYFYPSIAGIFLSKSLYERDARCYLLRDAFSDAA